MNKLRYTFARWLEEGEKIYDRDCKIREVYRALETIDGTVNVIYTEGESESYFLFDVLVLVSSDE